MFSLVLAIHVFLQAAVANPNAGGGASGRRGVGEGWQDGTVESFSKSDGAFDGTVCVDILQPRPSCGWQMEIFFYDHLEERPTVDQAQMAPDSELPQDLKWFKFTNKTSNGNLTSASGSSCLDIRVQAAKVQRGHLPTFEARMVCACYDTP